MNNFLTIVRSSTSREGFLSGLCNLNSAYACNQTSWDLSGRFHGISKRNYGATVSPVLVRKKMVPNLPLDLETEDERRLLQLMREDKLRADLSPHLYYKALRFLNRNYPFPRELVPTDYTEIPDYFTAVRHLSFRLQKHAGRNDKGRITVRHRGGGFARRLRMLDMSRTITDPERIVRIEYDPNRSGRIALTQNLRTMHLSYILAPAGVSKGQILTNDGQGNMGNTLMLQDIPDGTAIYNIETRPLNGGRMVRAAGTSAVVIRKVFDVEPPILRHKNRKFGLTMSNRARRKQGLKVIKKAAKQDEDKDDESSSQKENDHSPEKIPNAPSATATTTKADNTESGVAEDSLKKLKAVEEGKERYRKPKPQCIPPLPEKGQSWHVIVKLPSGELRVFPGECKAMIGRVSNVDHDKRVLGTAGRRRRLGWRPSVRGICQNARDHPNGGGRGSRLNGIPKNVYGQRLKK